MNKQSKNIVAAKWSAKWYAAEAAVWAARSATEAARDTWAADDYSAKFATWAAEAADAARWAAWDANDAYYAKGGMTNE